MTTSEAKELYLASDCSYFVMCTYHYNEYMQYRQLGLPKEQEDLWKNEKLRALQLEIQKTGDYCIFEKLYNIAVEFRDYKNLRMLLDTYQRIKQPLTDLERICIAEVILGKRASKVRSGMIYWAYDVGQKGIAILLMDQALRFLELPYGTDVELDKRIQKGKRLCKKLNLELELNYSEMELRDCKLWAL